MIKGGYADGYAMTKSGTWTATEASGGTGVTITPTGTFKWFRFGNEVHCYFRLAWNTQSDSATAKISGLPYTCDNNSPSQQGFLGLRTTSSVSAVAAVANTKTATFANNGGGNVANSTMSAGTFAGVIVYTTSDPF